MKIRVADYISWRLAKEGIRKVFLLSGGGMMHLLDGLARNEDIEIICNHHEQACGIAAESYARIGGLGACFATSGPGATNLLTAVAGAWLDSVPLIFFTGQSKVSQTVEGSGIDGLRQFGMFEINIIPIVRPITKFAHFVRMAEELPSLLEQAIALASSGRPGPVFLDIPLDVQGAILELPALALPPKAPYSRPSPSLADIQNVVKAWNKASRPVILAGHGVRVADAADALYLLAQQTGTPVVTTPLAKDIIPYEAAEFIGHPGVKGDRPGNFALQAADFILALGCSYHVSTTGYELDIFAPQAWKIQVDIDPANFKREAVGVSHKVLSGVAECVAALLPVAPPSDSNRGLWMEKLQTLKGRFPVSAEPHKIETARLNIYQVLDILSQTSQTDTIFVADAGSAFYASGQGIRIKKGQRFLASGGFGAMGWTLPAATGAASAAPQHTVFAITGDGSLQTNVHELALHVGNHLNVTTIVLNNGSYVSIKNTQNLYFEGMLAGVDQRSGVFLPDLERLSQAYGLAYQKITTAEELTAAIFEVYSHPGPRLLDVQTNIEQEIIPTVSAARLEDGRMQSMPLHVMSPFLPPPEQECLMAELISP